jgi:hypothetical protein
MLLIPVLLHENVTQWPDAQLAYFLSDLYHIFPLVVNTDDHCHCHSTRVRKYTIMYLKAKIDVRLNPYDVYAVITSHLRATLQPTRIQDLRQASWFELVSEAWVLCSVAGVPITSVLDTDRCEVKSFRPLLTPAELHRLEGYESLWLSVVGTRPYSDPLCVFNLADNPEARPTWSVIGLSEILVPPPPPRLVRACFVLIRIIGIISSRAKSLC